MAKLRPVLRELAVRADAVRPRICMLLPNHWAACAGGAEYQARYLVEELARRQEYEITYLARAVNPGYAHPGYRIVAIKSCCFLGVHSFAFDLPDIYAKLKAIKPDLIYQRVGCAYTGIAAGYAKHERAKCIWHIANESDVQKERTLLKNRRRLYALDRWLLQYGIRKADGIIAQTERQARLLSDNFGRKATVVIRNFHPTSVRAAAGREDDIAIVWVATLSRHKRPEVFARLAEDLRDLPRVRFVMIGRLSDKRRYTGLVKRIDGSGNIEYMGELSQDEVNAHITRAYLFVNTSEIEGFPNTFIQAWLRGVPVVSLSVDPDGILQSENLGRLSGTYGRLVADIKELVRAPHERDAMGVRARNHAERIHSLRNVDRLKKVIDGFLASDSG